MSRMPRKVPAGPRVGPLGPALVDTTPAGARDWPRRRLALLPERGLALAVDAERVYVATADSSTVAALDRVSGMRPRQVGRGPVAVALDDR